MVLSTQDFQMDTPGGFGSYIHDLVSALVIALNVV